MDIVNFNPSSKAWAIILVIVIVFNFVGGAFALAHLGDVFIDVMPKLIDAITKSPNGNDYNLGWFLLEMLANVMPTVIPMFVVNLGLSIGDVFKVNSNAITSVERKPTMISTWDKMAYIAGVIFTAVPQTAGYDDNEPFSFVCDNTVTVQTDGSHQRLYYAFYYHESPVAQAKAVTIPLGIFHTSSELSFKFKDTTLQPYDTIYIWRYGTSGITEVTINGQVISLLGTTQANPVAVTLKSNNSISFYPVN